MEDFFDSIITFFNLIWDFISNLISSLATAVQMIGEGTTNMLLIAGYMPTYISAFVVLIISVGVINYIVGRDTG